MQEKEKEIKKLMEKLELTRQEAEELWESDNTGEMTEEQKQLDTKASKIKMYVQSEKTHNKGRKKERKIDIVKLEILQNIQQIIGGEIEKEKAIHFVKDNVEYSLNLVRHTKKK